MANRDRRLDVLIVEDDPKNIFLLKMAFEEVNLPIQTTFFENEEKLIAFYEQGSSGRKLSFPVILFNLISKPPVSVDHVLEVRKKIPGIPIGVMISSGVEKNLFERGGGDVSGLIIS